MKTIGRYGIRKTLGAGAMADVYEAFDPKIDRALAIKSLKPERCVDAEYVKRFVREAKAVGALSHKNIVTVFDVGEQDGAPYILMEMVDGRPLDEVLAEIGPMPVERALKVAAQIADALDYAHKKGIVHRDVKPSNIMMLKDGETVKIMDFGIARVDDPAGSDKTIAGMVLGTPQYMSPEQALGAPVDGRSDLFSIGVVLFQMLTGQKPFPGETIGTLVMQITRDPTPPVDIAGASVPRGVQHIVEKSLAKSPDARFQSGAAMKSALVAQLQQIEEAREGSSRPSQVSLRNKLTGAMAAAVALVMLASVAMVHSQITRVLTDLAIDSGASLTTYIATGSALPLIEEQQRRNEAERRGRTPERRPNAKIERFVRETISRQSFVYLHIANHQGVVMASSDPALVDGVMPRADRTLLRQGEDGSIATYVAGPDGGRAFDFTAPVTLRNTRIGEVRLGLSRAPLSDALRRSLALLCALAVITILAVAASAYYLIGVLSKPLRTLRTSLEDLAADNVDVRISETREDEIGAVYHAFNLLADKLSQISNPDDGVVTLDVASSGAPARPVEHPEAVHRAAHAPPASADETPAAPSQTADAEACAEKSDVTARPEPAPDDRTRIMVPQSAPADETER